MFDARLKAVWYRTEVSQILLTSGMFRRFTFPQTTRTLVTAILAAVCLAPLYAQRLQQPVATVVDLSGQVSIQDGDAQRALSVRVIVKQGQMIVTGDDGWAKFEYTDGSTFEIFPRSKVVFQEHPANWEHLLNIWIGHVKVWIQHAPGVPNYKNVTTPTAVISVRGTVFSIDVPSDDETDVAVDQGIVDVRNTTAVTGNIPRLRAGDSIRVLRNVPLAANRIDKGGIVARGIRAAEEAFWIMMQRRAGGIGGTGGPVGTTGGAQGDKTKTGGNTPTAPTPPSAPTPPPAPPGGGG